MGLPSGFDPVTGTFKGVSSPKIQSNHNTSAGGSGWSGTYSHIVGDAPYEWTYSTDRRSLWKRFSNAIASIGNWIDDMIEPASGWLTFIGALVGAIALVIWIFSDFNLLSIIGRVIVGIIAGCIMMVCLGIAVYVISFIFKAIRFVFWNGWTFLAALALAICIIGNSMKAASSTAEKGAEQEYVVQEAQPYRCTAWELNVRSMPSRSGAVLGKIQKGEVVDVYEKVDGFGRIRYNGEDGYVSMNYLRKASENL